MAYISGGLIEASDYNSFQSDTDDVFGNGFSDFTGAITGARKFFGYGQTIVPAAAAPLVSVAVNQFIGSLEWKVLQEAITICSTHQLGAPSVTIPPSSELDVADDIQAHGAGGTGTGNFLDNIGESAPGPITKGIRLDPTSIDSGSSTLTSPALSDIRAAAWSNQLTHIFRQTFISGDGARNWFNSGGQIRMRATRTFGSPTTQNAAWDTILASMGTVAFDFDATADSTSIGSGTTIGYYDLTTSFQQIYSITSAQAGGVAAYDSNRIIIQARSVSGPIGPDDKGSQIEFRIDYQDIHVGGGFFDQVDGTFTSFVDLRDGNVFLANPDTATFRTGIPLTTTSITTGT